MQYQDLILMVTEFGLKREDGKRIARFKLTIPSVFNEPIPQSFDWDVLNGLRQPVAGTNASKEDALALGRAMAEILLPGETRRIVLERLTQMQEKGKGLRLRLALPGELHRLPWEFLAINRAGGESTMQDFLALEKHLSIVRQPATTLPLWTIEPQTLDKINATIALASPSDQSPLDIKREQSILQEQFSKFERLNPTYLPNATLDDLQGGVANVHLFHFAGHGMFIPAPISAQPGKVEGRGALILESEAGMSAPIDGETLGVILRSKSVRVAVLGACQSAERDDLNQWSGVAESLLKAGLGAVVGMQFAVKDAHTIGFMGRFYEALLSGMAIDEAVTYGRIAVAAKGDARGLGTPVLYLRDSDGVVFPELAKLPNQSAVQNRIAVESETHQAKTLEINISSIDARGSQGLIVGNAGTVNQHFGDNVDTGGGDYVKGNKRSINTGGGAYIAGGVKVGGDFVGRDKVVNNTTMPATERPSNTNDQSSAQTPEGKLMQQLLNEYFSMEDIEQLCFEMNIDEENLRGATKQGKARAMVLECERAERLGELKRLMRVKRPNLKARLM